MSAQHLFDLMITTGFRDVIADRLQVEHRALAARWFERLLDLVPVDARSVFPTGSLLDHVPALILEIAAYVRYPEDGAVAANTAILGKARELGALRHGQRASLHQVLREYQILEGVLGTFVLEEMQRLSVPPLPAESVLVVTRLNQAVNVLSQATVEAFVSLYTQTIAEQTERLEQFTRMAAHEWRQPLSALQVAVSVLRQCVGDPERSQRTMGAMERAVSHLVALTQKLETVARMHGGDNPVLQQVPAATVVEEAARQLREMADAHAVQIRIADDLPSLTVDVGRMELTFVNLLSNAIKYSDPGKPVRFVEVTGASEDGWCRFEVRDNGIGIPTTALATVFGRFTRIHDNHDQLPPVPGMGLGLAIVDDCVRAMGGRIDVQSVEREGTTFVLALPAAPSRSA